jgi:Leucine-rich repeat (LRR) protein
MTGVSGKLPIEIGSVTEITSLEIEDSDLSEGFLPESIVMCTKLEYLSLYKSKIPSKIPEGYSSLKSLGIQLNS